MSIALNPETRDVERYLDAKNTTSFTDNMALPVHGWFRYSAGFSAQWAEHEIRRARAERVLDPFAGSGTTLLAAQSAGAESVGIDVHPFVSRVARAKLAWSADLRLLSKRADDVLTLAANQPPSAAEPSALVKKCFPPEALVALRSIQAAIERVSAGDEVDELLWLAFVSILRPCSPVGTAQWQYVLPTRRKANVSEPISAFRLRVGAMTRDMAERQTCLGKAPSATYAEEDVRTSAAASKGWADLVLTSPPYANNFDYADATRLEMSVLGEIASWGDLKPLREKLVRSCSQQMVGYDAHPALAGAELAPIVDELAIAYEELATVRLTKGGKKAYHSMVVAYFHDMARAWHRIRQMTAPGGKVCFVIGDSAPYGVHLPVERWLGELAVAAGFESWSFEKVRDRNIKWENRKHRVPLHEGRLWVQG